MLVNGRKALLQTLVLHTCLLLMIIESSQFNAYLAFSHSKLKLAQCH